MKPVHFFASFAGHIVMLVLITFMSVALRHATPAPPETIRISFGELPLAAKGRKRAATGAKELPPARKEIQARETPKPLEKAKPKEAAKAADNAAREVIKPKAAEPKAITPVKPGAKIPAAAKAEKPAAGQAKAEPSGGALPKPGTGSEAARPAAPLSAGAGGHALSAGSGGSVLAQGDPGVGDTYLGLVQSKIGRRWQPSAAITGGKPFLEAVVSFRVSARGEVISPSIFQGSGLSVFDREALRSVMDSNPLPPPPARFQSTGLNIQFTFTYRR